MSRRRILSLLLTAGKAAITISAFLIIGRHIDFAFLLAHRDKLNVLTLALSLILLAGQTSIIAGLRLKLVLGALGLTRRLSETSQVVLTGFFFEQIAFGFVGGDAMRVFMLHRGNIPFRTGLNAIVIDRCLGALGLLLLALAGLPGLISLLTGFDWHVTAAAAGIAIALSGALTVFLLPRVAKGLPFLTELVDLGSAMIRTSGVRKCVLSAFALAVATHCINVFIFFLIGRDLGMNLGIGQWFLIAPPVLLISMLPISAGGWGLREASFVIGLESFGIRPEEAIIPSIMFGWAVLTVSLPGSVIWLANRNMAPRSTKDVGARDQRGHDGQKHDAIPVDPALTARFDASS